jgi:beta-lactamase class A
MKMRVALIGLLLIACAEKPTALPGDRATAVERAPVAETSPAVDAEPIAAPSRSAGPRPGARAAAPALVLAPETADLIDARLELYDGKAAIVVADGRDGRVLYAVNPDERVFAASLYKLAVLLEAERRIDAGTLKLTDSITVTEGDQAESGAFTPAGTVLTVDQALERAIVISDNAAALALVRRLGVPSIHATLDREQIGYFRFTPDGTVATARAIATFFVELARGSLVSSEASARMLARLGRQRIADRFPAALPTGAVVAHKTGNLGFATHDAGIIRGPGGALTILVVLTWGTGEGKAVDLIKEIAALAYHGLAQVPGG